MFYLLTGIVSIYANGVIVFRRGKQKRQLQALNMLMKNLAFSNGMLALSTFPLMIFSLFAHEWLFGKIGKMRRMSKA